MFTSLPHHDKKATDMIESFFVNAKSRIYALAYHASPPGSAR